MSKIGPTGEMNTGPSLNAEISRQLALVRWERWGRATLSLVAILMTAIYLPVWLVALFAVVNAVSDALSLHYMRALDPRRHPTRYRVVMGLVFLGEISFSAPAAMVWQHPENMGQSLAIGMIMAQLLQLAMVRAIHMPFGKAGLLGVALPTLVGNAIYWVDQGDNLIGFVLSTIMALAGLSYTLLAMHSSNRMHRISAEDRAAAVAGDRAKSRFLAQMSHELRTPLNAILGMGHAELRRNKDTVSQNRLSVLIASAEGLSTILDDILDMSAVQAGRLPIRLVPIVPKDEIATTLALFQPGIDEAALTLTFDAGPNLTRPVMFDPQRLRQCLSNLMSNALKNTAKGGIHVSARLDRRSGANWKLTIEVCDTGPGIPDHLHRTIFEPFVQARTQALSGAGANNNGLGLSICRAMARQMDGDLTIAPNAPDRVGAKFILTFRVATAPDMSAEEARAARAASQPRHPVLPNTAAHATHGLRVLVVDDIATNRLVASTYLKMLGATTFEAASGDAALSMLSTTDLDLILLDMNMPGMNGLETLTKIRALPGSAGTIPIIAMTADAMEDQRNLYLSSGMDGYLAKPINPARVEAEINAVLDKGQRMPSD